MAERPIIATLARQPVAIASLSLLAVLFLAAIIVPEVFPASYAQPGAKQLAPPSAAHWFGTDLNGRDLFVRVFSGLRISFLVGIAGAAVSLLIGTVYGLVAGYCGGKTDALMMRVVDVLYSIPRLIFILVLINALNESLRNFAFEKEWAGVVLYSRILILILSLGFIEWLTMARIVRGQVLSVKSREFVLAARALGQSHGKIVLRHILPNISGVIVICLTLTIPAVILDESFLSFLGLGVEAPLASLGTLVADGASALNPVKIYWWLLVFPAGVMILLLLALNFLGDALRDALDVRTG
jgi:peptide/nickel transport system permease protein/oligopeptide transport system permease protein